MHDEPRDREAPESRFERGASPDPVAPATETEICALCDIVNDTYVAPRAFVLAWRLASDGE